MIKLRPMLITNGYFDFYLLNELIERNLHDQARQLMDAYIEEWKKERDSVESFFLTSKAFFLNNEMVDEFYKYFRSQMKSYTDAMEEIATLQKSLQECKDACDRANNRIRLQYLAEKSHLSASSIAEMRIPGFPNKKRAINKIAKIEKWPFRAVTGKGGMTKEYVVDKLPPNWRDAIRCWRNWLNTYD